MIISIALTVNDIFQIWNTQPYGKVLYRCGNGSGNNGGWYINWTPFSPGTATTAQVLKGYTFSSAAGSNLTGTYDPGDQYNSGYNAGYSAGNSTGYNNGYNAGKNDGYNSASKVKWSSGQVGTSGPFGTSWSDGKTANTLYLNISGLGYTPYLVAAYCVSNSAHWSIRYGDTCVSAGSGTSTCTNIGNFAFNSSNCQIPTHRTTNTTWNWYACGYY